MRMRFLSLAGAALAATALILSGFAGPARAEEKVLKVVTGTPVSLVWNQPLKDFIAAVNERGKGVVQVELVGGPEAVPVPEQFRALSSGLVDMHFGPNQYFQGDIPASQAFNASNRSAMDLRADGAWDVINGYYEPQGNIHYLGYFGSGYEFILLLREPPPEGGAFGRDFSGLRLRGTGTYAPLYDALGVTLRDIQVAEVHTALERGAIDGLGWVTLAATDLGFDDFIKARILPTFWQGDLGMAINLDSWNALPQEARTILNEEAAKAEAKAHAFFQDLAAKEAAAFAAAGTQTIELPGDGAAAFLDTAYASRWDEILQRMGEDDGGALRDLFYRP
ncbi:hypothetical protein ACFOGJ_13985 [Marinibaculum pumilum]|uniref:C4-dicarboxylate ABC transporter substrate-binding protein n=1 Tax=Marinibaculum pumilum TaxID=1766165 RepID=A0ABV7L1A4_9PROT